MNSHPWLQSWLVIWWIGAHAITAVFAAAPFQQAPVAAPASDPAPLVAAARKLIAEGKVKSARVTIDRPLTHLPLVAGAVLALLVWRQDSQDEGPEPDRTAAGVTDEIVLPGNASRGRRRGHSTPRRTGYAWSSPRAPPGAGSQR